MQSQPSTKLVPYPNMQFALPTLHNNFFYGFCNNNKYAAKSFLLPSIIKH